MAGPTLIPDAESVELLEVRADEAGVTLVVRADRPTVCCPDCGLPATRIHSWYQRTPADLPWQGLPVQVLVHTRRWFCDTPDCTRRIFTERFPTLVPPHGRRTARLDTLLTALAFALGGRPGARLLAALGPVVSHDTLITTIRRTDTPAAPTPRVLGVDDWSYRRGQVFGTILVDLERHRPVDVLTDRTAATFAAWLTAHPGIAVIARDRAGAYADGARQGAPAAIQVADRFHLIKNLGETLERLLDRHHRDLRAAACAAAAADVPDAVPLPLADPPPARPPTRAEREQAQRQARRQARYDAVHQLLDQGVSVRAVARQLGLGRRTVRRLARAEQCPPSRPRAPRPGMLASHEAYLRERWEAGERNTAQLWRELRERGFVGSPGTVRRFLARWRDAPGRPGPRPHGVVTPAAPPATPAALAPRWRSPRQVAWLLRRADEDLTPHQATFLAHLVQQWPAAAEARALAREFDRLMRARDAAALDPWLARAAASELREFAEFAGGLRRDDAAVAAALTEEWSSGQVEGQVARLKLVKRAMFGRANADLLRRRVLRAA